MLWTARMCESDLDVMRGGVDLGADRVWRLMPTDEVGKWVVGCGRYVQMWLVRWIALVLYETWRSRVRGGSLLRTLGTLLTRAFVTILMDRNSTTTLSMGG